MELYNGYERNARNYTLMEDAYEYTMADGYLRSGISNNEAVFDVFFRKIPQNGGYAVMAGVDKIIDFINNLKFDDRMIDYFRRNGFSSEFVEYIKNFKFTGTIKAIPDGTPVFPNEPLVTVKAPIIEAQIVETALLAILNGAISHSTGARRIVEATPKNVAVMDFGPRRADGCEAAIDASIYAMIAGCRGTSNCLAADMLNTKAVGTMAHSWVESFDSELEAFIAFAKAYPNNCFLLVDTVDTLNSGVPNAIKTFEYMRDNGILTDNIGIRIDSGDLAYLSKNARKMLVDAGFPQAKICLSNGLKAETIEALVAQGAEFDSLGVGDNISKPEGNVGCVYKEVAVIKDGKRIPKIKLSEDAIKIVNPDYKKLYRAYDKDTGYAIADIMVREGEGIDKDNLIIVSPVDELKRREINNFNLVELQKDLFRDGELVYKDPSIWEKAVYCEEEMNKLYPEVRRTMNPHNYHVSGTEEYVSFKNDMIRKAKKLELKR